ncbi:MAG TPA: hypothetical protein VKE50_02250 [Thermoanaerobaculia bacterium]|nr:hypothetical protein [Thermoanaerobaculia bacterium]
MSADAEGRGDVVDRLGDGEFLAAFESATLPEEKFHHADHVRAVWLLLGLSPPAEALNRFAAALARLAASFRKPALYHETITWAYVLLIRERIARFGRGSSFEEFAEANPDLMTWRPSILKSYYREETLASPLARRVFLLPDRLTP